MKLDLACGRNKISSDYIGVDIINDDCVDIIWDLNKYPYPFPDNSIDEIQCISFIEHVDDLVAFMEELYRIMKVGAMANLCAPYWNHINTWRDPTHKRGIANTTLFYFDRSWRETNNIGYEFKTDFHVIYSLRIDPDFLLFYGKMSAEEQEIALSHYNNVYDTIEFKIIKK